MEITRFFYRLHLVNEHLQPQAFIGNAFPVTPNGGLLTSRHVIDIVPEGQAVAVFDAEKSQYVVPASVPVYPKDPGVDLAIIPNALNRPKPEFFPILSPPLLKIGEDAYTFGFFAIGAKQESVEQGYFAGRIVNFFDYQQSAGARARVTLPFPVLEGMSGSPILTYHNGPKVVGIGIGNRQTRILASELIEIREGNAEFKESINRIVEYGVAHHPTAIVNFLMQALVQGFVVSDARVAVPNLE